MSETIPPLYATKGALLTLILKNVFWSSCEDTEASFFHGMGEIETYVFSQKDHKLHTDFFMVKAVVTKTISVHGVKESIEIFAEFLGPKHRKDRNPDCVIAKTYPDLFKAMRKYAFKTTMRS